MIGWLKNKLAAAVRFLTGRIIEAKKYALNKLPKKTVKTTLKCGKYAKITLNKGADILKAVDSLYTPPGVSRLKRNENFSKKRKRMISGRMGMYTLEVYSMEGGPAVFLKDIFRFYNNGLSPPYGIFGRNVIEDDSAIKNLGAGFSMDTYV